MTQVMTRSAISKARREDARDIARLFLISSDGFAAYIWGRMDMPGRTLEEIGAARYAREGVAFSYENCLVARSNGGIIGMVHAFPMESDPDAPPEDDPVLRPYSELEDPGSLYISGLAVDADHRGRGLGGALMDRAERHAADLGLPRLSLICFERNHAALAFYRHRGFREITRRPIVPDRTLHYEDGDALLLVCEVGSAAL